LVSSNEEASLEKKEGKKFALKVKVSKNEKVTNRVDLKFKATEPAVTYNDINVFLKYVLMAFTIFVVSRWIFMLGSGGSDPTGLASFIIPASLSLFGVIFWFLINKITDFPEV
tara:strand:- start:20 stop:358 length:339 start_codon:yes stop_codon:yes gene_type:complete